MPDKRYRAGSHRVRKGAQIVGPGVVAHRGPVAGAPYGFGSLGARSTTIELETAALSWRGGIPPNIGVPISRRPAANLPA
jgi:hypothetical protein